MKHILYRIAIPATFLLSVAGIGIAQDEKSGLGALDQIVNGIPEEAGDDPEAAYESEVGVLDFILSTITSAPRTPLESRTYYHPGGKVTSGFGYRTQFGRMHRGMDFGMPVGDTVKCPLEGSVLRTGFERAGYGRFVIITHDDGLETRYAHLSKTLVKAGDRVCKGEAVALSGNTGHSTGPHLHFETRWCGLAVDPRNFFKFP